MDNDTEFLTQANAKIEALDEYLSDNLLAIIEFNG